MLSVMNTSDLPNFTTDSSENPRRSEPRVTELRVDDFAGVSDGVNNKNEIFSKKMTPEKDIESSGVVRPDSVSKMEARVSSEGRRVDGKFKAEKLTMREDDLARVSSVKSEDGRQLGLRPVVSDFGSAYAMVDEGAAARMYEAFGLEAEKALSYGFEPGDMVWGKVKSHPWWPGHIFHEAFASSSVRRTKREGHVLVAFFGDSSYGWFDPAELIPFEPNYAEKSRQTSSKSFLKAVDEAVDEGNRRCALGLTCRCRNPFNFRPSNVHGYFAVDVSGYEAGSVYSVMQIKKARERFQPEEALQFVQQLALSPMNYDRRSVDTIRKRATMLAYRKAVFEEYDETYAQAFGVQPVRPSRVESDQIARMPIRAPLSGPMVTAEALGEKKSTPKSAKVKEQLKKDKYLFKRRDEANEPRFNHVAQGNEDAAVSSPPKEEVTAMTPKEEVNAMTPEPYVLQKRVSVSKANVPVKQDAADVITRADNAGRGVRKEGPDSAYSSEQINKRLRTSKEEEVLRKSAGKSIGIDLPTEKQQLNSQPRDNGSGSAFLSSDFASSMQKDNLDNAVVDPPQVVSSALSPQSVDLDNIEVGLPQVVNDLLALALDPFHGVERDSAAVVRQVLLRFRSLVYQKSLVLSTSESESSESPIDRTPPSASAVNEIPSGEDVKVLAPKHPKNLPRPDDPTKAGRKRSVSDRQEEMSAKRLKKLNVLKSLAAEKKGGIQKIPEVQREQADTAMAKSMKTETVKKLESPARRGEPAMLVMKFPQQTRLPSGPELKARFGRFGPLNHELMRVYYKSNTCRVVFIHRTSAEAAYRFAVGNSTLFGNDKVSYQVKDYGGQSSSEPEPIKWQGNGIPDEVPQLRPMGGSDAGARAVTPVQQPRAAQNLQQQQQQLKSCLKKQQALGGGDEAGGNVVARESPRVKFMLGGEESNREEQLMMMVSNSKDPNKSADGGASSSSSSIGMDINSKNFQKVMPQTLPPIFPFPPPPPPPRSIHHHDVHENRPVGIHQIKIEPKTEPSVNFKNYYNVTPNNNSPIGTSTTTMSMNNKMDISHQMLSLLMRCNDIVTDVKCTFGYVPYHPL